MSKNQSESRNQFQKNRDLDSTIDYNLLES